MFGDTSCHSKIIESHALHFILLKVNVIQVMFPYNSRGDDIFKSSITSLAGLWPHFTGHLGQPAWLKSPSLSVVILFRYCHPPKMLLDSLPYGELRQPRAHTSYPNIVMLCFYIYNLHAIYVYSVTQGTVQVLPPSGHCAQQVRRLSRPANSVQTKRRRWKAFPRLIQCLNCLSWELAWSQHLSTGAARCSL